MSELNLPPDGDAFAISSTGKPIYRHDPLDDVHQHLDPSASQENPAGRETARPAHATPLEARHLNTEYDVITSPGVYVGEHYVPTAGCHVLVGDMVEPGLYAFRGYFDKRGVLKTRPITLHTSDGPNTPINQGNSILLDPDTANPTFMSTKPTAEFKKAKAARDKAVVARNRRAAGQSK